MNRFVPTCLKGDGLRTHLFALAAGAILIVALGFSWTGVGFGWKLGSTAEQMAYSRAEKAVNVALAPICANRFLREASTDQRAAFAKNKDKTWGRGDIVAEVVQFPGQASMNYEQKEKCVEKIDEAMNLTSAKK